MLLNPSIGYAQSEEGLSTHIAKGMAQFRNDIFERKQSYNRRINEILSALDTASVNEEVKKTIYQFIKKDVDAGGLSNDISLFDQLPSKSPFRNRYVRDYIYNNQDYGIDKALIFEFTLRGVLTPDIKINQPKLKELLKDFAFLDIEKDDRLLLYNSGKGAEAMLVGYVFEDIELTIHNRFLDNHYTALDRIDRYPNVNNGKLVEFLQNEDERLLLKGEKWDKIIIRDNSILENSAGPTLNSLHDNLTAEGCLYLLHRVKSNTGKCGGLYKEEKILKLLNRFDFELIEKMKLGCNIYFKFKSIKEEG